MQLTTAEAEWAMRAVVFDRLGEGVGEVAIEAVAARRGDPPNIRRLRISGPKATMAELERGLESISAGVSPPLGIIARMSLAVSAAVARAYASSERTGSSDQAERGRRKAL